VIHWPVPFAAGKGLSPKDPNDPEFSELDTEITLAETWKEMIKLEKTGKVGRSNKGNAAASSSAL
jgi:L-glyceraldehyde reductase